MRAWRFRLLPLILAMVVSVAWAQGGGPAATGNAASPHRVETYTIDESDYAYRPAEMTWHVGDTVKLTIVNTSDHHAHMFMMGRKPLNMVTSSFGVPYPKGWKATLLASDKQVTFSHGTGVLMDNPSPGGVPQPGAVSLAASSAVRGGHPHVTLTFTVPDRVGTWHYACFEQKGQHYTSHHMVGTIHIVG